MAAMSNVEVGQTTYPANRGRIRREGKEGRKEAGGGYLDICARIFKFLVTPLLMGLVCLLSKGRFEEPVRHWKEMNER